MISSCIIGASLVKLRTPIMSPWILNYSANKSARDNDEDNCKHNYTEITPHMQKLPRLLNAKIIEVGA